MLFSQRTICWRKGSNPPATLGPQGSHTRCLEAHTSLKGYVVLLRVCWVNMDLQLSLTILPSSWRPSCSGRSCLQEQWSHLVSTAGRRNLQRQFLLLLSAQFSLLWHTLWTLGLDAAPLRPTNASPFSMSMRTRPRPAADHLVRSSYAHAQHHVHRHHMHVIQNNRWG